MIFSKLFKTKPAYSKQVQTLYNATVDQSRLPGFYLYHDVADTVEGRYDMIMLHMFIVMRKLKSGEGKTEDFTQSLYDLMFADMDLNLRELGVGDMGLARRVPKMAEAFYGRIKAYEDGLEKDDNNETLKLALDRNLYRKVKASDESLTKIAQYLRQEIKNIDQIDMNELLKGKITFGQPPAGKNEE